MYRISIVMQRNIAIYGLDITLSDHLLRYFFVKQDKHSTTMKILIIRKTQRQSQPYLDKELLLVF